MSVIEAPVRERRVTSADGTDLAYYVIGEGPRAWLMPPAMGAPLVSMKHILERFHRDYRIVTWDMRGFYRSGAPADPSAYRFDDHMADMLAVRRAEGLSHFVLGGWSMGVQLSLEYCHRHPEHVRALVLVNGPHEILLSDLVPFAVPGLEAMAGATVAVGQRSGTVLNFLSRKLLGMRGATRVLYGAGLFANDAELFEHVLADFRLLDWGRYFKVIEGLRAHSVARHLAEVRVPTLITAGGRDRLTPPRVAERMHREIAGSELFVEPRGTHYMVVEYPDELNAAIARFLDALEPREAASAQASAAPPSIPPQ